MPEESLLKNVASERAVLSGLLQHGKECFLEVELFVNENSFTLEFNKVLFRCIQNSFQHNDTVGYTEILSSAKSLGVDQYIESDDSVNHIKGVMNTPVHIDNVAEHAKKLKRLEFGRQIQNQLRDIYLNLNGISGEESIASILALAENPIQDVCLSYIKEDDLSPKPIGQSIQEYMEFLKENEGRSIGIPTGFPGLDRAIGGGLRRKCVDLIGARAKAGKSVLADNVALEIAGNQGIPVLMLDTEMSQEDHWNRILANISKVEINDIAEGNFFASEEDRHNVFEAAKYIEEIPYDYISIAGRPFEEILSIAKRWLLKTVGFDENGKLNDCVIIYDYLKLMTSDNISNNMAEFQVLGFQITQLHNFCVENDCPCLSFVQLNRDGITKEAEDAVSGSDRLVWLCTSFTIFKTKTEEERMVDGVRSGNKKLIPIVCRHGPGLGDDGYICMQMDGQYAKINELGTIRALNNENRNQEFEDQDTDPQNEADGQNP